jgi:hypothetical protein
MKPILRPGEFIRNILSSGSSVEESTNAVSEINSSLSEESQDSSLLEDAQEVDQNTVVNNHNENGSYL